MADYSNGLDLAYVEDLVKQLYNPKHASDVSDIQERLQKAQQAAGWQLADALLRSNDVNVRFFGALTFTVQINKEGATLPEGAMSTLLTKLLQYTVNLTEFGESDLVIRKLCSALVAYFVLPNSSWRHCLRHLVICLRSNCAVSESEANEDPASIQELFVSLKRRELATALTFGTVLAENTIRIELGSVKLAYCHERVALNVEHSVQLTKCAFENYSVANDPFYLNEAIHCYQAWVSYAKDQFSKTSAQVEALRGLFGYVTHSLYKEETFDLATEFLIDLFTNYEEFLTVMEIEIFLRVLDSPWASQSLLSLEKGEMSEILDKFGQLCLGFGQLMCTSFFNNPDQNQSVMPIMHRLTRTQSYGSAEQGISNAIVDFWEHFITNSTQSGVDENVYSAGFVKGKNEWLIALQELCAAIVLPVNMAGDIQRPPGDTPFAEFRTRVRDTIQMSYTEFDLAVMKTLVEMALRCFNDAVAGSSTVAVWAQIEAILSCLDGLSDSLHYSASDIKEEDTILQRLFNSDMFACITNFSLPVPTLLRRRALRLIGEYQEFLGRNETFLLGALDMLCHGLMNPSLMDVSAKACSTLCDTNRKILGPKAERLLEVTNAFFISADTNMIAKDALVGAAAALIQGLQAIERRQQAMLQLLSIIERDFQHNLQSTDITAEAMPREHAALVTLPQLESVGKASQAPDSAVFDLTEEEGEQEVDANEDPWLNIQEKIIGFLQILVTPCRNSGSVLEAACKVIKTGFQESQPGPFKFDSQLIVDFLTTTPLDNPRLDYAMGTATAWVTANASSLTQIEKGINPLLEFACRTVQYLSYTQYDPELAYSTLEFFDRVARHRIQNLLSLQGENRNMVIVLSFTCLARPDPLPKRAAAQLWTSILSIPASQPDNAGISADQLILTSGPVLTRTLIDNFGGTASRSDLDNLSQPLRKLVFRQPQAKEWIEKALLRPEFPSKRVSEADKERFATQLVRLRGDRKSNTIARDFWVACRGTPLGYG